MKTDSMILRILRKVRVVHLSDSPWYYAEYALSEDPEGI